MEFIIIENSLPLIFKFSNLWNILPFYGTLPKWMWLLCSLNSATKKIWNNNREMFFKWGKNYKIRKMISFSDNQFSKDIVQRLMYYSPFSFENIDLKDSIKYKLAYFNINYLYIFESNLENKNLVNLYLSDEESISDYLPTLKCPNYTPETIVFSHISSKTHNLIS